MAIPDPITIPMKILRVRAEGPDAGGIFTFIYSLDRPNAPAGGEVFMEVTSRRAAADDQYFCGQTMNITFDKTP